MIVSRRIRVIRRLSGAPHAELIITVKGDGEFEWSEPHAHEIRDLYGRPWAMVDGARNELSQHEINVMREVLREI